MRRSAAAAIAVIPCVLLLLPAAAVTALLALVAGAVRAIARLLEPRWVPWTELIAFDPVLGWKPRPNLDARYLADHDDVFRVVTDAEGWPGRRTVEQCAVLVVGDSFAFGYGVDAARSFAAVDPALRVKALGAPGYSMVHGVRLLEQLGARTAGKVVVWFVYLENDLQDNLVPEMRGYRAPFVRRDPASGRWHIADAHLVPAPWTCSDADTRRLLPHLCVPGPLADRAYAACDYLLERAATACRTAGARLVVFTIPHPMQLTPAGEVELAAASGRPDACDAALPDERLAASCRRLGVPFVAGRWHLSREDYKRREGIHWNERGHRRVAALLRQIVAVDAVAAGSRVETAAAAPVGHPEPAEPALVAVGAALPQRRGDEETRR